MKMLARDGLPPEAIHRLVSPIGVGGIASKWPAAIAVGVAAQLLQGGECSLGTFTAKLAADSSSDPAETCPPAGCAACTAARS